MLIIDSQWVSRNERVKGFCESEQRNESDGCCNQIRIKYHKYPNVLDRHDVLYLLIK